MDDADLFVQIDIRENTSDLIGDYKIAPVKEKRKTNKLCATYANKDEVNVSYKKIRRLERDGRFI